MPEEAPLRLFFALVVMWMVSAAGALAEARVALVIGNSAYASVSPLTNPVNDATDLAAALERIGFEVTLALDLGGFDMRSALRDFRDEAEGADMALVYFAGHGIEIDKQNFLIPVDADLKTDSDVMFDTIPLDLINEAVSGARTLRMVLVDACRNNPFLGQIRVADSGRSIGRGLSAFEPTGGTMVAFAAKGGTVALDGSGRNSPFMKGLLEHLEEPGLDINLLFRKVRDSVLAETNNRQEPFTYGSLPGREIYLVPPVEVAAVTPVPAPVAPIPVVGTPEEEFAWRVVKDTENPEDLQDFIVTFPRGVHFEEAFDRILALSIDTAALPDPAPALPGPTPAPPAERDVPPAQLALLVQTELNRIGCNAGTADGIWGRRSEAALRQFAEERQLTLASLTPTTEVLTMLKELEGRICPISCAVTEVISGDQCVTKTCPGGQRLSSRGQCYTPQAEAPRPRTTAPKPPVVQAAPPPAATQCFTFNGQQFCE